MQRFIKIIFILFNFTVQNRHDFSVYVRPPNSDCTRRFLHKKTTLNPRLNSYFETWKTERFHKLEKYQGKKKENV